MTPKQGTMDFSLRSSHSSSSKTIMFPASPPHLSNSGSFQTNYKKKFVKEKGKSNYSIMLEPPDVKHAMDVAKKQSNVSSSSHSLGPTSTRGSHTGARWAGPSGHPNFYIWWFKIYGGGIDLVLIRKVPFRKKVCFSNEPMFFLQMKVAYKKDAKENLHYTTVADRPDIKKATQAAKQASEVSGWLKRCQSTMHREQAVQGTGHLEHVVRFVFLCFRWSTEPSTARKAAMGSACLVAPILKWPRRQPS